MDALTWSLALIAGLCLALPLLIDLDQLKERRIARGLRIRTEERAERQRVAAAIRSGA